MDINDFGLPVYAHSATCWLKGKDGAQLKDEAGKKIGIEFWSMDSKHGLKAQIAAQRAQAELEEKTKDLQENDDLLVERIEAMKQINIATAAIMFKSVKGDLKFNGEPITTENIGAALERLPPFMVRQMSDFVSNPEENYIAKP